ncbi:MAG: hypothetical protein O7D91_19365, partial [Planctomycetota bacterium]|nr:hypothetical protein [Planctomycetota bacterium]
GQGPEAFALPPAQSSDDFSESTHYIQRPTSKQEHHSVQSTPAWWAAVSIEVARIVCEVLPWRLQC